MVRTLIFFLLFSGIGGAIVYQQSSKTNEMVKNEKAQKIDKPFDILFQVDKVDVNQYNLAVTIELDNGSFVISPYSQDSVYGHFEISIPKINKFILGNTLLEIPNSVEELDPILNSPVRFVRRNTTYTQQLKNVAPDDFNVTGLIEFVLEPSCIPYDVEFNISNRSGVLEVNKTKTSISKEYKL